MKTNSGFYFSLAGLFVLGGFVVTSGCEQIIGLDGPYHPESSGGTAGGGVSGPCEDGAIEECYSGDPKLKGIGACQPGARVCSGNNWDACMGEGVPSIERCDGTDSDCDGAAVCSGNVDWVISFGGAGEDSATAVDADPQGNIFVSGNMNAPINFGGGSLTPVGGDDMFVVKLDPTGAHLWSKSFGSGGTDNVRGLAVDAQGNVFIVGTVSGSISFGGIPVPHNKGTIFIAKFDPNGQHIWSKSFVGASGISNMDATVDGSGNVILSTTLGGSIDLGMGPTTIANEALLVAKLDLNGNLVYGKLFEASKCCGALRSVVAGAPDGSVGFAGSFTGFMTLGATTLMSAQEDIFVAKLSPTGEVAWATQGIAGPASDVDGIAVGPDGGFVISGSFEAATLVFGPHEIAGYSNDDAFVAKFDANGSYLWGRAFGENGAVERGAEIVVDNANNVSFTGTTSSNSLIIGTGQLGLAGMFVTKLDSSGNVLWAKSSDAATTPYPESTIGADKQGHTLLAREFLAPFTFGGTPLTSKGMADIFVIKLRP
jgi:hypothetical protein